jgi:2-dehydro-3-deoxygluconokinase
VLRELADAADIVFVGDDEAQAVWGVERPAEIRALLPNPPEIVIKHGSRGATLLTGSEEVFEAALKVDVVEPVGAGDACGAGTSPPPASCSPPRTSASRCPRTSSPSCSTPTPPPGPARTSPPGE